jgi:hypothetical protein
MTAERKLRRFASRSTGRTIEDVESKVYECPLKWGYHNAEVLIDEVPYRLVDSDDGCRKHEEFDGAQRVEQFNGDPRWPAKCECGYEFTPGDDWQVFTSTIYVRTDTNERITLRSAGPGAMWNADWLRTLSVGTHRPSDGIALMVRTPAGDWFVDGKAKNGPGWDRTGDPKANPPTVSAYPSIGVGTAPNYDYHGWLRGGMLVPA